MLGGQRCGTTSMFRYLERHPSIRAGIRKEVGYFCSNYARGESWYRAHFPSERARLAAQKAQGEPVVVGEATPYYLFHPAAPSRAAAVVPDAKLVVLVRNPVDRAFSSHQMQMSIGTEQLPFEAAIEYEPSRLAGEEARLIADPTYHSIAHRHHSYMARGRYAEQLERWFGHFPREQFLVLSSEEFFADPDAAVRQVTAFLGVADMDIRTPERRSQNGRGPRIEPHLRERMAREFDDQNQRLYELLGTDYGWH